MNERVAILNLYLIPGIGPTTLLSLKEQYGLYVSVLKHNPDEWHVHKSTKESAQKFLLRHNFENILSTLQKYKQEYLTWDDDLYPEALKFLASPPPIIFYRGNLDILQNTSIAIVGTRTPTSYSEKVCTSLVPSLVRHGYTIVSGFQRGVDQIAHQTALDASGSTIAVLGTGIDIPYPPQSNELFTHILNSGSLILSEFPPGTPPDKGNFPRRNRIVAALSTGVLVTEAALKSGSLVTTRHAIELGKEVWAVPGPITSRLSEGTNYLLKQGAKLVTSAEDIVGGEPRPLEVLEKTEIITQQLSGWRKDLYIYISQNNPSLDECIEKLQRPITDLLEALSEMELNEYIKKTDNGNYEAK